jgi:hypothetical protein
MICKALNFKLRQMSFSAHLSLPPLLIAFMEAEYELLPELLMTHLFTRV